MMPRRFVRPLTPAEKHTIDRLFKGSRHPRVRRRANAVRLSFLGYTVPQIAEVTGLSVSNVGFLIHTGVKAIRKKLGIQVDPPGAPRARGGES